MDNNNGDGAGTRPQGNPAESTFSAFFRNLSRREFLKLGGVGTLGVLIPQIVCVQVASAVSQEGADAKPSILAPAPPEANAKGMVVAIPSRCTGCRRCEAACTAFNEGKISPTTSKIKVARNMNFGPKGAQLGFWRGEGHFGNFLIVQDTCRQCAHPIPCALACPNQAIQVVPPVNARVVNVDKCTGCQLCQAACPWGMMSFDSVANKSIKCTLCDGNPECVKACPTAALQYIPWQEKSRDIPQRWVVPAYLSTPANTASTCNVCHK